MRAKAERWNFIQAYKWNFIGMDDDVEIKDE